LYTFRERPEIGDTLKLVIRQLDVKMLLDAGEQVERLEAIDAQLAEKIVVGIKLLARNAKVRGCEFQNFVSRVFQGGHTHILPYRSRELARDSVPGDAYGK
jgi:hypothetical protein